LEGLVLPVLSDAGVPVGSLVPVGDWVLDDPALLAAMAEWRSKNRRMFLTQFEASAEGTRKYLAESVLASPRRRLHMILDDAGVPIGHIGLANIDGDCAELDNLMRGRSGGHPRLVHFAELAFLRWAFSSLDLQRVIVRFLSNNWMVRELHEGAGFAAPTRTPLRRHEDGDFVSLEPCAPEQANVDYGVIEMSLTRAAFNETGRQT
jgi:RimJ/RimL family protein N-acetyltransferase